MAVSVSDTRAFAIAQLEKVVEDLTQREKSLQESALAGSAPPDILAELARLQRRLSFYLHTIQDMRSTA